MRHVPLFAVVALLCSAVAPLVAHEGKPLVFEGRLGKDDPRDAVRTKSAHRVHDVKLEAGKCYQIDLASKDFDTFLRLEDVAKKQLAFNDDLDEAAGLLDSRLFFAPLETARFRLIVTSYEGGKAGAYTLRLTALPAVGKGVAEQRRLTKDDPLVEGRHYHLKPLPMQAGAVYVIDAVSEDFPPLLRLTTAQGKPPAGSQEWLQGDGRARLVAHGTRDQQAQILATTGPPGKIGAYTLRWQQYRGPAADADEGERALLAAYRRGEMLSAQGRYAAAAAEYEKALALARKAYGSEHATTLTLMNNLAELYRAQAEYAKAKPLYERSLEIREKRLGKDHPGVAVALNNLGLLYHAQGQYTMAESFYRRCLQIWEKELGKDHPRVATALNNLAEIHRARGRYGEAEPLYERCLGIRERQLGEDAPEVATALNNLALLYRDQGRYGKAEALVQRSLAIRERRLGKEHPLVAQSRNNLGALYQDQGRYGEAERLLRRNLEDTEDLLGKDHPAVGFALHNLARLYLALGRYGQAEAAERRTLTLLENRLGKEHPDVAVALGNLAEVHRLQARYDAAESLLQRSLEIRERRQGADHPDLALTLNNLGVLYQFQGRYGKAEPLLKRSLAIRERQLGTDHPDVIQNLNNLAEVYRREGEYGKVELLTKRTLERAEKALGEDHPSVALALNNLAGLYHEQGQYDRAEALYRRSLGIKERQLGKDHPDTCASLSNLAGVYAAQKRWPLATAAMDRVRRGLRRHLTRELTALPEPDQLTLLRTSAAADLHGALSVGWLLRSEADARRFSAGWLINGQALAQEALAAQTLLQRDSAGRPWAALAAELQGVRRELATLSMRAPPREDLAAHRRLLAEVSAREQELAGRVAQESGGGERAGPWQELGQVQKPLAAHTALVLIGRFPVFNFQATGKDGRRWGPARYAAWLIDGKEVHLVDLGEADAVEGEVRALRGALAAAAAFAAIRSEGEPEAEKVLRTHLDRVARRVLHPLLPHLKGKDRWLVSPDGALWLVPWAALTLPDGKYVVEQHTLSYLVSARDVVPVQYKVKSSPPAVLANPDFDLAPGKGERGKPAAGDGGDGPATRSATLGAVRFAPLPGTAAEAKLIAPKLRAYAGEAPKVYSGAAATEAAFKALRGPKVLVLATHGFFLPDVEHPADDTFLRERPKRAAKPEENPLLRSGLALAGANQRATAAERGVDDGILTALEILQADLRGTELVVLSACETGLGEVRNGEGVAGLRQAFQLAGAQSVVASLWQVPDRQTAHLMGKFFDHLAAGRGRGDALRLAQLEMIRARRQREGAAHPFYWAAFTLTGNWR